MTPLRAQPVSVRPPVDRPTVGNTARTGDASTNPRNTANLENDLIEAYREENNYLRNLKADALLYSRLLGIKIEQDGQNINFTIERMGTGGKKRLGFVLEETEQNYVFTLKEAENCSVPEYFYDVIEFEKKVFPQFFYKAMQAVYETRTNE